MDCPVCKVNLVMSDRQGIEIDYCPKCRGVWLDRGELDKIIERSVAEGQAPPPPPVQNFPNQGYQQSGYHQPGYHKPYKKKSMLGELFDF